MPSIRYATPDDAPLLAEHRRLMFADMGYGENLYEMESLFHDWVRDQIADEQYTAWVMEDADGAVIASAGVWIAPWFVNPENLTGKFGNLMNIYVIPSRRRQGIARHLVDLALDWSRARGLFGLQLNPSEAGRSLYAEQGFVQADVMFKKLL